MADQTNSKTLRNWTARRAGSGITVTGENIASMRQDKVTNCVITPPTSAAEHHVIATDGEGVEHKLVFA